MMSANLNLHDHKYIELSPCVKLLFLIQITIPILYVIYLIYKFVKGLLLITLIKLLESDDYFIRS